MTTWLERFDPVSTWDRFAERGYAVALHRLPRFGVPEHEVSAHQIDLQIGRPTPIRLRHGDARYDGTYRPGDLIYSAPGMACEASWGVERSTLFLTLSPDFVRTASGVEPHRGRTVPTVPETHAQDPLIEQLGRAMLEAARVPDEVQDKLYLDTMASAMAARLVNRFGRGGEAEPRRMIDPADYRLRRAIDFIMDNRASNLSLAEMAASAGLSVAYFSRAFRNATGRTPHQFLNAARIEDAKRLIEGTDRSGAEIAYELGFSSQSHLIRVFRQHVALTPSDYRGQFSRRRTVILGQDRTKTSA